MSHPRVDRLVVDIRDFLSKGDWRKVDQLLMSNSDAVSRLLLALLVAETFESPAAAMQYLKAELVRTEQENM